MFDVAVVKEINVNLGPISVDLRTNKQRKSFFLLSIGVGLALIVLVNSPISMYFPKLIYDLVVSFGSILFVVGAVLYKLTVNDSEDGKQIGYATKVYNSVLYNLQHLDRFTSKDLDKILETTDDLVMKNAYLFSDGWKANWQKLKYDVFTPPAIELRNKLVEEIKEKLKNI